MRTLTPEQVEEWVRRARDMYAARGSTPEVAERLAEGFRALLAFYASKPPEEQAAVLKDIEAALEAVEPEVAHDEAIHRQGGKPA